AELDQPVRGAADLVVVALLELLDVVAGPQRLAGRGIDARQAVIGADQQAAERREPLEDDALGRGDGPELLGTRPGGGAADQREGDGRQGETAKERVGTKPTHAILHRWVVRTAAARPVEARDRAPAESGLGTITHPTSEGTAGRGAGSAVGRLGEGETGQGVGV